jgi:hypothetical protein
MQQGGESITTSVINSFLYQKDQVNLLLYNKKYFFVDEHVWLT